jgi:sugar phosphate permease
MRAESVGPNWRWAVLALGITAQAATCTFLYGLPVLLPTLRSAKHLSLLAASVVVSAPTAGLLLTLIAWGALADRYGERKVIAIGTAGAAVFLALALFVNGAALLAVLLGLAGASAASVNAASGRVVMGWFSARERGLAMGARQTAQPLGVAIAALVLPPLARGHHLDRALAFPTIFCAAVAIAVWFLVVDPVRPPVTPTDTPASSPYRDGMLWRIHAASALLVVPQFAVSTFTAVFLVGERHWSAVDAGRVIFVFQLAGAAGRIGSGLWSDRVASRLSPMRQLALASASLMGLLAIGAATGGAWVVVVFGFAAVVTVADNGLGYTAVAESAGQSWTGRALGVQNTGQNVAALLTAPLLAAVIGNGRYALGFALVVTFPLLALPLTPVARERARLRAERSAGDALPVGQA